MQAQAQAHKPHRFTSHRSVYIHIIRKNHIHTHIQNIILHYAGTKDGLYEPDGKMAWVTVSSMSIAPQGDEPTLPVAGAQAGERIWTVPAILEIVDVHTRLTHVCLWKIGARGWWAPRACSG